MAITLEYAREWFESKERRFLTIDLMGDDTAKHLCVPIIEPTGDGTVTVAELADAGGNPSVERRMVFQLSEISVARA